METLGLKLVMQREMGDDFNIRLPSWIGDRLGELVILEYNGDSVTIFPAR